MAFGADGILATGGSDGTARLWRVLTAGNLMREVCAVAGTPLTRSQWHADIPLESYQKICK